MSTGRNSVRFAPHHGPPPEQPITPTSPLTPTTPYTPRSPSQKLQIGPGFVGIRPGFDARAAWVQAITRVIAHGKPEGKLRDSISQGSGSGRKRRKKAELRKMSRNATFFDIVKARTGVDLSLSGDDSSHHSAAVKAIPKVARKYKEKGEDGSWQKNEEVRRMPPWMIYPFNPWYRAFLYLTVLMAGMTGFVTPAIVAFQASPGYYPYNDFNAIFNYANLLVFGLDMCISFFVAYYDDEYLVTDRRRIANRYLGLRFWVDLLAWIPLDLIIVGAVWPGASAIPSQTARYISLLQLFKMLRMYRIGIFLRYLQYNLSFSLVFVTLLRNAFFVLYCVHWGGCVFYFIGRVEHFTSITWLAANTAFVIDALSVADRYILSLYWSVFTFAGVGYGDFSAHSLPEAIWCIIYILFGVFAESFIIGTIILLVAKGDERTARYRDATSNLRRYIGLNNFPKDLRRVMEEGLRLWFNNADASDDTIMPGYPSTVRRRLLRHNYLEPIRSCFLFRDCKQKFLDAVMAAGRAELFMPGVEVLAKGDHVNELMIVVQGLLEVVAPIIPIGKGHDTVRGKHTFITFDAKHRMVLEPGDCYGDVAFFTEFPQPDAIRAVTVAKVFSVPRPALEALYPTFPISHRTMLDNVAEMAEELVDKLFEGDALGEAALLKRTKSANWGTLEGSTHGGHAFSEAAHATPSVEDSTHGGSAFFVGKDPLDGPSLHGGSDYYPGRDSSARGSRPVGKNGSGSGNGSSGHGGSLHIGPGDYREPPSLQQEMSVRGGRRKFTPAQQQAMAEAVRVRTLVSRHIAKVEEERTTAFMYAASQNNVHTIRRMLQHGYDPDTTDYDGRSALMLACVKGHIETVQVLLAGGCDCSAQDLLGSNALSEACTYGWDALIDLLCSQGAELGWDRPTTAGRLCTLVFRSEVPTLIRLIRAGADVDAGDYDDRTALHISAAESNLQTTRILVERGGADVRLKDRWGQTALDEARRVDAEALVAYLEYKMRD